MINRTTLKKHADLMDRMAGSVGVDLEEAMLEGRLSMDQLTDAVFACTGCSNPEACGHWLTTQEGRADATPDYCRNADMMRRLADGLRA